MEFQAQTPPQSQRKLNPWLSALLLPLLLGPLWVCCGHVIFEIDSQYWNSIVTAILLVTCLAAAIDDTRRKKIANWITYPAFLWMFVLSIACSLLPESMRWLGPTDFLGMLAGGLCCFVIVLVPYVLGVGGGGDAKLAAVIGAALGFKYGLIAIGTAFVVAAIFAIVAVTLRCGPVFVVRAVFRWLGSCLTIWVLPPSTEDRKFLNRPLPMGISFFCGVLLTVTEVIPKMIL